MVAIAILVQKLSAKADSSSQEEIMFIYIEKDLELINLEGQTSVKLTNPTKILILPMNKPINFLLPRKALSAMKQIVTSMAIGKNVYTITEEEQSEKEEVPNKSIYINPPIVKQEPKIPENAIVTDDAFASLREYEENVENSEENTEKLVENQSFSAKRVSKNKQK